MSSVVAGCVLGATLYGDAVLRAWLPPGCSTACSQLLGAARSVAGLHIQCKYHHVDRHISEGCTGATQLPKSKGACSMVIIDKRDPAQAAAGELSWARRLNMALEAAKGVLYLHSRTPAVLHRDLKSANLLVDRHWHVKLADFNLAAALSATPAASSAAATNPRCLSAPLSTCNRQASTWLLETSLIMYAMSSRAKTCWA